MDRKGAWIVALSIILGFILLGCLQVWLPLPSYYDPYQYQVGRYQNMTTDESAAKFLILDTATGDILAVDRASGTSRTMKRDR